MKLLHRLLFKTPGKTTLIKKNIKTFNGFDFKKDSDEYTKKLSATQKFEIKQLKSICEMLDLDKKGNKEEISERIVDFLIEPKDSGKPTGGGRPKRTAAVKANNRGRCIRFNFAKTISCLNLQVIRHMMIHIRVMNDTCSAREETRENE